MRMSTKRPNTPLEAALNRAERIKENRPGESAWLYDLTNISVLADEVRRLNAENDKLRAALIAAPTGHSSTPETPDPVRLALGGALHTIREARLFIEGRSHIRRSEAVSLLTQAEADYRASL